MRAASSAFIGGLNLAARLERTQPALRVETPVSVPLESHSGVASSPPVSVAVTVAIVVGSSTPQPLVSEPPLVLLVHPAPRAFASAVGDALVRAAAIYEADEGCTARRQSA